MAVENGCKVFVMSELFAGSRGMDCENAGGCRNSTFDIYLAAHEIAKLNEALPEEVQNGMAVGPTAAKFILENHLGKALCSSCAEKSDRPTQHIHIIKK